MVEVSLGSEEIQRICAILDVASANDVAKAEFEGNWPLLAIDLCNYAWKMRWIKRLLRSGKLSLTAAFQEILWNWVEWNKEKATLGNLMSLLVSNGLNVYAELLSDEFGKDNVQQPEQLSMPLYMLYMPLINNGTGSPTEKVLKNPLIFTKIFKMLSFEDQKNFRLVTRMWMTETLALWRKRHCLVIKATPEPDEADKENLTMEKILQLFNDESIANNSYSLVNPPFLHCRLDRQLLRPFPNGITAEEEFFWKVYGSQLTHLCLWACDYYDGSFLETFQWILLKVCKNLQKIDIDGISLTKHPSPNKIEAVPIETSSTCGLNSFRVEYDDLECLKKGEVYLKILQMLPNLKELNFYHQNDEKMCQFLLEPTNNDEFITLEKLIIWDNDADDENNWQPSLRNYIEMFGDSLKEIQTSITITDSEEENFNLYAALAKCIKLQVLYLRTYTQFDMETGGGTIFFNLGNIHFFGLKSLYVEISKTTDGAFDFESLRNLPNLKTLTITYPTNIAELMKDPVVFRIIRNSDNSSYYVYSSAAVCRGVESGKWINEGAWLQYTPQGIKKRQNSRQQPPLRCEYLRHFLFDGWALNLADLELLRGWFPNLIFLEAILCSEAFPLIFDYWKNIKTVSLLKGSDVDEQELESARREHEDVRIVQHDDHLCGCEDFEN